MLRGARRRVTCLTLGLFTATLGLALLFAAQPQPAGAHQQTTTEERRAQDPTRAGCEAASDCEEMGTHVTFWKFCSQPTEHGCGGWEERERSCDYSWRPGPLTADTASVQCGITGIVGLQYNGHDNTNQQYRYTVTVTVAVDHEHPPTTTTSSTTTTTTSTISVPGDSTTTTSSSSSTTTSSSTTSSTTTTPSVPVCPAGQVLVRVVALDGSVGFECQSESVVSFNCGEPLPPVWGDDRLSLAEWRRFVPLFVLQSPRDSVRYQMPSSSVTFNSRSTTCQSLREYDVLYMWTGGSNLVRRRADPRSVLHPNGDRTWSYGLSGGSYVLLSVDDDQTTLHTVRVRVRGANMDKLDPLGPNASYIAQIANDSRRGDWSTWRTFAVCPSADHGAAEHRQYQVVPADATRDTWCAGNYTPDVTLNVPDGYRDAQPNQATVEVTFTKHTGDADCPTQTATYLPNATDGEPASPVVLSGGRVLRDADGNPVDEHGNPVAPPSLNAACTYTVDYPASAADDDLRLVTPVDDPNTAAREDQVSVDDPQTRATSEIAFFAPQVTIRVPAGHVGSWASDPDDGIGEWARFWHVDFIPVASPSCVDTNKDRGTEYLVNAAGATRPRWADSAEIKLDRSCVYNVVFPANNLRNLGKSPTEPKLQLVTPVNNPNTAAREDQVASDDPDTTWDERATEATYDDDACPLPSSMSAWPVRTSRRIGLPALLGGTQTQQWEWEWDDTPPAAFNWNSDTDDCARAFRVDNLGLRGIGSHLTSAAANPPQPNKWLPLAINNDDQQIDADTTADHSEYRRNVVSAGARTWTDQASSITISPTSANMTHGPHTEWNITRAELDIAA